MSTENQKLICSTIYNHIIAIQDYDISSLPRLKSRITLLKPTLTTMHFTEEDCGLQKVNLMGICELIFLFLKQFYNKKNYFQLTEGKVQVHYVEGSHITMMNNDKVISIINEEWMEK